MNRYIAGFLLVIGLILIVIILIIHGSNSPTRQPLNLNGDAKSDISVQFSIDNPISAASTHNDIIVNVGNNQSSILITKGYQGQIVSMKTYPMNTNSYAIFLRALMINGFTLGNNSSALADERGHCALGDRFIYEIVNGNGNDLERYWSTSCNTGTFLGDIPVIQQLFKTQIPDYDSMTGSIVL